jgi:DOPA 4,5-dioxygenase
MKNISRPKNRHEFYHAHIYFEKETLALATRLSQRIGRIFGLAVGELIQRPIGPHPKWSCQITFAKEHFSELIPWLDLNRAELTIFVHGLTGDHFKDHTDYAYWLGESETLNLSIFGIKA